MFRTLLAHEIHDHLLTFRFAAALLTTFVLVIVSVWVLGEDYHRRLTTYTTMAEKYAQEAKEVYVPSRILPMVFRPPSALGIFAQGEEKRLGNSVEVHRWTVPAAASDSLTDNMLLTAQQPFDLLAVFTTVLSLFGILIGYDAVNGDRERGTLKLVCSYPLRRPTVYAAKMIAGVTVLLVPMLFSFVCALLVLQFVHGIGFSGGEWLAIGLMLLNGGLYGALFVGVGLFTSSLVARSSTSLILSLFFWTVSVLLIPGAANEIATAATPAPSPAEVTTMDHSTRRELNRQMRDFRRASAQNAGNGWGCWNIGGETPFLFDTYPDAWRDTEKYISYYENAWQERAEQIYKLVRRQGEEKQAQARLADSLGWISPAYHLRHAFTTLAGTDYASFAQFMEAVRRYRVAFLDELRARGLFDRNVLAFFSRRDRSETINQEDFRARTEAYQKRLTGGEDIWSVVSDKNWPPLPEGMIPRFSIESAGNELFDALPSALVLAVMTVIAFCAGFAAFLRYDVARGITACLPSPYNRFAKACATRNSCSFP